MNTRTFDQLLKHGHTRAEVTRMLHSGEIERLARGFYCAKNPERSREERHLLLAKALERRLTPDSVFSHSTAGLFWGLPVPRTHLDKVHVTRPRDFGANLSVNVHVHHRELLRSEITSSFGVQTTSLERTAIDLARMCDGPYSLAVVDKALSVDANRTRLQEQVDSAKGRRGIGRARFAYLNANSLSESVGESISRYWMIQYEIPLPTLQKQIVDSHGRLIGRVDFAWEEQKTVGEFDGLAKYQGRFGDLAPASAIAQEERREVALQQAGWKVIRWIWRDLQNPEVYANWLLSELKT